MTAVCTLGGLALATRLPSNDPWRKAALRFSQWSAETPDGARGMDLTAEARR